MLEPESRGGGLNPDILSRNSYFHACLASDVVENTVGEYSLVLVHTPYRRIKQSCDRLMVEPDGIEPTTSCLQSRRSPN
jgi:hypothetical protein